MPANAKSNGTYNSLPTDLSVEGLTNPLHGICLSDTVGFTETTALGLLLWDPIACTLQADIEIHTVNAGRRVILETEIDMLVNTEPKVACSTGLSTEL